MKPASSKESYADLRDSLSSYWHAYGGFASFAASPFTHFAILLEAFTYPIWAQASWPDFVLGLLPPILGFTLAGYALIFAFGDDRFRRIMAGAFRRPEQPVFYTQISATFLHFIVVQVLAIAFAVIARADLARLTFFAVEAKLPIIAHYQQPARILGVMIAGLAYFPFTLTLANALAAAFAIHSVIRLYVDMYTMTELPNIEATKSERPPVSKR